VDFQFELPQCTLSTRQQAVLDAVNHLITFLPDQPDSEVAQRLGLMILEVAEVAPQAELALAAGFTQERSVRIYKDRLAEQGLAGLFDRPIPGRPAIITQTPVEKAFLPVVLAAVITEHTLPDDPTLAERVNRALAEHQATEAGQVTASMMETLRLRWGIRRLPLQETLNTAAPSVTEPATQLGRTQVGGAFALAILLVETGWLKLAQGLPIASGYAVTATQWLLTAIFSVIFGVQRAFHLDDLCDIGFALVTGRARSLSHSTFQHILRAFPESAVRKFYERSAHGEVRQLDEDIHRLSLDGHNLPRYTQVVDLEKGKIGNTGRILKAEELVWAFDLDAHLWLAMRAYQGTNKLSHALVAMVREILKHRGPDPKPWRLFFDKGGSCGHVFRDLLRLPSVLFYTFAKRTEENVAQWELLATADFEKKPFTFDKHADLPADQQPTYRLADTEMTLNVWNPTNDHIVDTVTLRAIVLHDPQGKQPAECWPVTLLTNDRTRAARALLNEQGDHWGQEFAHRIGRHDLASDILPVGYVLTTTRDEQGELQREVEFDNTAFFLSAWLHCLVFNLMTRFAQALGGAHTKLWAGTLLRKFIRRPATLYLIGKELHVVLDPFPGQDELQPLLDKLNTKRVGLPWLNHLVVQLSIAQGAPIYPLTEPEKRNRLFGDG
jgi:hypothetical protein